MNKALFLDRDGVINHDPGDYTCSLEEFHLLPGVLEAIRRACEKGYLVIVITNQGGIAKGLYTHDEVHRIHDFFRRECVENGGLITHVAYSPHHPDFGNSLSRKPGSLLVERALARFQINPALSRMVGDRPRDIECAEGAGVVGILVPVNDDLRHVVEELP